MVVFNKVLVDVEIETENGLSMVLLYSVIYTCMYVCTTSLGFVSRCPQLIGVIAVMNQY